MTIANDNLLQYVFNGLMIITKVRWHLALLLAIMVPK